MDEERYGRQMIIPDWGNRGQSRLNAARVGVVGVGGLGCPVSLYLAAAGVGRLILCDSQKIEVSNLNRQILYGTDDVGLSKVEIAGNRLRKQNPELAVITHERTLDENNIEDILVDCDLIVDALDNAETRHILNRFCVERRKPLVHAGVREFFGQVMLIRPPETACLACFFPEHLENHSPIPICGATAGVLGSMEANLAIRWLLGMEDQNSGEFMSVDLRTMDCVKVAMPRNPNCPVCSEVHHAV